MGYCLAGCNTGGLPVYLIKPLLEQHEIRYFVETGTASGSSVREAAKLFDKCWTIELIYGRPALEDAPDNVEFRMGRSIDILPSIIYDLNILKGTEGKRQWVLFWLDAHYSDDKPNETREKECPLLDEIEAIAQYGEDALIFIDDARLFFGHPPYPNNPSDWPTIQQIFESLTRNFPYHKTTITDDYILCTSIHVNEVLDAEWRERFNIRYPSDEDKLKSQAKDVYLAFQKYIQ